MTGFEGMRQAALLGHGIAVLLASDERRSFSIAVNKADEAGEARGLEIRGNIITVRPGDDPAALHYAWATSLGSRMVPEETSGQGATARHETEAPQFSEAAR